MVLRLQKLDKGNCVSYIAYRIRKTPYKSAQTMADDTKRQISVHLEEALIEQLEVAAKREIRSVSGEIAYRLRRSFERQSGDGAVP